MCRESNCTIFGDKKSFFHFLEGKSIFPQIFKKVTWRTSRIFCHFCMVLTTDFTSKSLKTFLQLFDTFQVVKPFFSIRGIQSTLNQDHTTLQSWDIYQTSISSKICKFQVRNVSISPHNLQNPSKKPSNFFSQSSKKFSFGPMGMS